MLIFKIFRRKKAQVNFLAGVLAIFLTAFWLSFPFAMQLLASDNWSGLSDNDLNTPKNTNLGNVWSSAQVYFKYLTLNIPDIPMPLKIIVHFLQFVSFLFIITMFIGFVSAIIP